MMLSNFMLQNYVEKHYPLYKCIPKRKYLILKWNYRVLKRFRINPIRSPN
jgi:hypothetical protein